MTALNAITNNALLSIVEWGGGALRAPVAGETAWVLANVANVDQNIIDANLPIHTKVVASVATVMTQPEQDAADANALAILNVDKTDQRLDSIRAGVEHDYGVKSAAFSINMSNGNGLHQKFTLGGDLIVAGDIALIVSGVAPMDVQLQVVQDGTGGRAISSNAWTVAGGAVVFGSAGAPVFSADAGDARRFLVLCYRKPDVFLHWSAKTF